MEDGSLPSYLFLILIILIMVFNGLVVACKRALDYIDRNIIKDMLEDEPENKSLQTVTDFLAKPSKYHYADHAASFISIIVCFMLFNVLLICKDYTAGITGSDRFGLLILILTGFNPITFYKNSEQLGDFEDYNMAGRTYRYMKNDKPLYPFGYGLSYTDFEIGNATLSADKITKGQTVTMTIPVTNKGKKDGTEVVQVYVKNPSDPNGPIKQLRAYKRVDVKAGQTVNATITINDKSLEWFDEGTNTIHTKEGSYELVYGNSSDATKAIGIKVE